MEVVLRRRATRAVVDWWKGFAARRAIRPKSAMVGEGEFLEDLLSARLFPVAPLWDFHSGLPISRAEFLVGSSIELRGHALSCDRGVTQYKLVLQC